MDFKVTLASHFKTTPPGFHQKLLPRGDIIKIIDNAITNIVICMAAPYGYGKTLAALSWLEERQKRAIWLTLDETDNSNNAFINSLTASILSFIHGSADIQDPSTNPQYLENPQAFLWETLSSALQDGLEITLVVDNFHFIRDEELLYFVENMIQTLLERCRIILIGRKELPPVFNDLVLKGHVRLLAPKELSFSKEETAEYFKINKCCMSYQDVEQIQEDTEGWPAALNAMLTLSLGGPVTYNEAARAYVKTFFETEIWAGLDERTKEFMLKTSILEQLTPASCHAATNIGATLPILNRLFQNGLFIARPEKRDTFYYHRVFRDFLLEKLSASGIDERELHMQVAWWLFERNEIARSFPYFYKAGDLYGISRALKKLNPTEMGLDVFLKLTDCITKLDVMDLKPYPVIVAMMAFIQYVRGNLAEMQALCHTYFEWISPGVLPISPEEYAEYVWEAGWLSYLNPDAKVECDMNRTMWCNYMEHVPHLNEIHMARCAILAFPSAIRGIRDYGPVIDEVEPFLKQAEEMGQNPYHDESTLIMIELLIAEYAYEKEDFKKADEIVRRIMPQAKKMRYADFYFTCIVLSVKLMRATRKPRGIDTLMSHLRAVIMDKKNYFLLPNFHAFELRNNLAGGQAGLTREFEEENMAYKDKPHFYLLYRHFTYVRGLLSTGEYTEAMLILLNIDQLCRKYKRTTGMIEVNVLKAIALYGLEDEDGACRSLAEALDEAKRYGFIRIISDDAKDLWPILALIYRQSSDSYINKVIISCKKTLGGTERRAAAKEYPHLKLTKTELRILKSLEVGMSYMEIALDNNIQLSTVKTHVHSIYSKLEANNRTSAIMMAQQKGILE